ncbi:hypothetical protein ES332_A11G136200v1 [Gossypium tomentosum]|uniref:Uncharacterized protein n=1 Tax=Gossypium tomentosum TaxID=34277 RepID=A0A5D2N9Y5_GOSTO|nr:hypothetical protein ES332_A11G136200v1 [Gossypium tomentosum]
MVVMIFEYGSEKIQELTYLNAKNHPNLTCSLYHKYCACIIISSENKPVPKSEGRISKSSKTPDHGVEKKPAPKAKGITCISSRSTDYFAGIPYEKSLGKFIPQDETDKLILKLVPRLQELQNELHSWTQRTNQKVKQAICRLNKDQGEIKSVRQEKEEAEQFKMEKKIMGESIMKRLSEIEFSLNNTTNQAAASASSCQEALEREQKALKDVQSWDTQRSMLLEELASEKQKAAELQRKVGKAKRSYNQIKMLWKRERVTMEKFLAQAASIRKERECREAAGKVEEDKFKLNAEKDMQKCGQEILKS